MTDHELQRGAVAKFHAADDEHRLDEKYFVIWKGGPTAFPIQVEAGIDAPGHFEPKLPGIKVRLNAYDEKQHEVECINSVSSSDDTFLTGTRRRHQPLRERRDVHRRVAETKHLK